MTPDVSEMTRFQALPSVWTSSPWSIMRSFPWPTDVMRAVRPVAAPLTRRFSTSTVTTGGKLIVAAVPRTHVIASWQTKTVSTAHFIGVEPSNGPAAWADDDAIASRMAPRAAIRTAALLHLQLEDVETADQAIH